MKALLLDVDGTLVDSNYHHVISWHRAISELGVMIPASTVHRFVGMGSDRFVADAVSAEFERKHGDAARELHRRYFHELSDQRTALPGARELLVAARNASLRVVLASSSERGEIEQNIAIAGISLDDVDGVVCGDDVRRSKPDPDVYIGALNVAGCNAEEAFAIGDTVWDAKATAVINVPFVGVTTGGTADAVLVSAGAVAVFDDVGEVAAKFMELLDALTHAPPRMR